VDIVCYNSGVWENDWLKLSFKAEAVNEITLFLTD
jgi:hypothetical protein